MVGRATSYNVNYVTTIEGEGCQVRWVLICVSPINRGGWAGTGGRGYTPYKFGTGVPPPFTKMPSHILGLNPFLFNLEKKSWMT
jgi:hypothetical protein